MTLVHPNLKEQAAFLSFQLRSLVGGRAQTLEMLKLNQASIPHLGFVSSQSPLGGQGHAEDTHAPLVWARIQAHCELELLTAPKADMRDRTVLVPTRLSVGLQNIYINYDSIYCLCVVGQTQMSLAERRSPPGRLLPSFLVSQGPVPTGAAEPTLPGRSWEGWDAGHREEAGLRLSFHTGFTINFECLCV